MTWIKICGITNPEDARASVAAGADALGFVFYPPSPRNIDPSRARQIIQGLPQTIEKIGVFVNQEVDEVWRIAEQACLTAVQFHGEQYRNRSQVPGNRRVLLSVPWTAMMGNGPERAQSLISLTATTDNLMAIMIDSGSKDQPGGTGRPFDWESALPSIASLQSERPVVVAGGLTPDNVFAAIDILRPWGVDVSSGVEASPGKKDAAKVRAFIQAVHRADEKNGKHYGNCIHA
jgi:phosphoribosylanthranilate isomerase